MARRVPEALRKRVGTRIRSTMNPWIKGAPSANSHFADAAKALKVHPMTVYFWYEGYTLPLIHNLVHFAEYYEVSLDYLVGRTGAREVNQLVRQRVA